MVLDSSSHWSDEGEGKGIKVKKNEDRKEERKEKVKRGTKEGETNKEARGRRDTKRKTAYMRKESKIK